MSEEQGLGLLLFDVILGGKFGVVETILTLHTIWLLCPHPQELIVKIPLKEIQSTWTQQPTANSSYPYVEISLGDVAAQRTMQLQLEQVNPILPARPCPQALALSLCFGLSYAPGSIQPSSGIRAVIYRAGLPRKPFSRHCGEDPGCLQKSDVFVRVLGTFTREIEASELFEC